MVIQTETDWYNLCFRHRRPPVSKYASSREKTISSRGRIKWTFKKKMLNCLGFHSEWNSRSGTKFHFGTCQWKRTSFRLKNRKSCCLICVSDLARKPREPKRLRLSRSNLSCECTTNFLLERQSFWFENHSGIMWNHGAWITSWKRILRWAKMILLHK